MTMNVVMKNFIISMVTVIIAGLALWTTEEGGGGANVPWLLLVGFGAGCLVFSFAGWWKRRALAARGQGQDETGRKKGRGR